ncbi:NAD(P)/FAD-dependent oxidoreductase [Marinitoga litoralis]|uniref:NAD(P)/FAD-dependent oxidoreductase n=1 Tax=Marinitoga litoralis TaxID=570855 RepID=UPI001961BB8A|nr:NAD(P)/FAD-dependent oxidoreductase [Marinitoga litoralis]MBM7559981.1 putative Rossmann fold flavoprotein [Marinitoga litoralis]
MEYDVIIIGAGPAGLFCSSNIKNKKVLILEKNEKPGKKILVAGGGKCNFTNNDSINELYLHYGDKKNFVKKALYKYSNKDLLNEVGFEYIITDEGKVFPKNMNSKTVLNWLLEINNKNNVEIKYNIKIQNIEKKDKFIINTNKGEYISKFLIIATGGKSYPMLGSTGDGYNIAKKFGHNIIKPKPALTPVIIKDYPFVDLSGNSMNVLIRKNKQIFKGNMLFTHKGFSGPVILNSSRYFNYGDLIKISFVNFDNEENFRNDFFELINNNKNSLLNEVLKKYNITKRFIAIMFKRLNLNNTIKCNNISKNERNKIINYLYNQEFIIEKVGDFNVSMVTSGGVDTKEIDSKTMESKLIENLYFIGEVLDVDGETGGYNIQWAFSSAKVASDSINSK